MSCGAIKIVLSVPLAGMIAISATSCATHASTSGNQSIEFRNFSNDFIRLYDETSKTPSADRPKQVLDGLTALFPEFYGVDRYTKDGHSVEAVEAFLLERTSDALAQFPEIRDRYEARQIQFVDELQKNIRLHKLHFPQFEPTVPIVLLHSLGEMNGAVREFEGRRHLVFGVDGIVNFNQFEDNTPFFQHELFHTHHSPKLDGCKALWCDVWIEGLAIYASKQIVSDADLRELLVDFPIGTAAAVERTLPQSLKDLKGRLDDVDPDSFKGTIQTTQDNSGLPPRRGYYLGYLIAEEAARRFSLPELADMKADELRPLFNSALDRLIQREATPNFIRMDGHWVSRIVRSEPSDYLRDNPSLMIAHHIVGEPYENGNGIRFEVRDEIEGRTGLGPATIIAYAYDAEIRQSNGVFSLPDGGVLLGQIDHGDSADKLIVSSLTNRIVNEETSSWKSRTAFESESQLKTDEGTVTVWYLTEKVK